MDALDDFQQRRLRVEAVIGYTFRDDEYLKVAISSGKVMFQGEEIDRCQNQLAIIGDSLLKLIYFTHNFPVAAPKSLNGPFDAISSNSALAFAAWNSGLAQAMDHSAESSTPRSFQKSALTAPKIAAATMVEALFGAVFLDSEKDLTVTQRAIEKFLARDEEELYSGTVLDRSNVLTRIHPGKSALRNAE